MCSGITTLAKIGKKKELRFVNMTYEQVRKLYEQRAKRKYDSTGAFIEENNGGNGDAYHRTESK